MVFNTIDKLRERPEHHRRRIALGISALVTVFVFTVWLSVHTTRGGAPVVAEATVKEQSSSESPFDTLKRGVAQVYEAFRGISKDEDTKSFSEEYQRVRDQAQNGELKFFQVDEVNPQ
jgi:hypothetical protein